jgi:hypothetical protein
MTTLVASAPVRPRAQRHPIVGIAAVEMVRLVRHPAFVGGLVLSLLWQSRVQSSAESWAGQSYYAAMAGWAFLWSGTLIAAALVAGRDRWLNEPDLFPGAPATPGTRVLGTAVALAAPVAVTAAAVAVLAGWFAYQGGFDVGDPPYNDSINPAPPQWVQIVVLTALAGLVGIAIAQFRRARLISLLLAAVTTWLFGLAPWLLGMHPVRVLHPFMYPSYEHALPILFTPSNWVEGDPPLLFPAGELDVSWREFRFDTAALWWHLAYVAGIGLLVLWTATRMADRERRWSVLAVVGAPLVLVGGVLQLVTAGQNW